MSSPDNLPLVLAIIIGVGIVAYMAKPPRVIVSVSNSRTQEDVVDKPFISRDRSRQKYGEKYRP